MGIVSGGALGGGSTSQRDGTELSEDQLFTMLANQRRRHIIHALLNRKETVDIGTLSEEIAAWEDNLTIEEISSKDRKRVYTALQQSHLPKLDEAGIVAFDSDRGVVEPTPALQDVEIYMDVVHGNEIPWSDYYLGMTVLAALVLGGSALGLAPFTVFPAGAWSLFVIVMFAVSALAHRYYSRRTRLGIGSEPPEFDVLEN